jgi:glycerol-3-phosphate cytidylyltransferase-like family protein
MENLVVLIRSEQADTKKGKNVVIGEPRSERDAESTRSCKVVMEKLPDGEEKS